MSGFIGDDQVAQIKSKIDLVDLVGTYTPLKKAGANFTGCCPFHVERTPSFQVYAEARNYHCFGCGANGDAIALVRDKERMDFVEAIEFLARRCGHTVVYGTSGTAPAMAAKKTSMLAAMELATRFYELALWDSAAGAQARDYLIGRGLSEATCRRYRLGWAVGNGTFAGEARAQGIADEVLAAVDLVVDRNGRMVDRFFGRITIPICDRFGNPIAFSARLLPEAEARLKAEGSSIGKYVNSKTSALYEKSRTVWNLHRARAAVSASKRIILMEGPTDVMAADQAGVPECVAIMGTALTTDHVKQIGLALGETGRLYVCLDGDGPGVAAARKAVATIWSAGYQARVVTIPDGLDPAELFSAPKDIA